MMWLRPPRRRRKGPIECSGVLALTLSLADFAAASAQTATPDGENGRYSFNPVADGVLRLDTRTGQVSQCSRSDAGWACKVVPDERAALETEIVRLQAENATLKKELFGPWAAGTRCADQACNVKNVIITVQWY
jgi:hypothetical protein